MEKQSASTIEEILRFLLMEGEGRFQGMLAAKSVGGNSIVPSIRDQIFANTEIRQASKPISTTRKGSFSAVMHKTS